MSNSRKAIWFVVMFVVLVSAASTFSALSAQSSSKCDCPKDDPATHGAAQVLIDKELSTAERMPSAGPFGYPKSMTICMTYDQTNKGYTPDMKLIAEGSVDGRAWFPLTIVGTRLAAETVNGCLAVSPTRYVRVGWPQGANVVAPGPRVTAQVQVGY